MDWTSFRIRDLSSSVLKFSNTTNACTETIKKDRKGQKLTHISFQSYFWPKANMAGSELNFHYSKAPRK